MDSIAIITEKRNDWYDAIMGSDLPEKIRNPLALLWDTCCDAARNGEKRKFVAVNRFGEEI